MQMQAASAAGIAKEAALSEEKAALEGRLRKVTAAYHILEDEVTGISYHVHVPTKRLQTCREWFMADAHQGG